MIKKTSSQHKNDKKNIPGFHTVGFLSSGHQNNAFLMLYRRFMTIAAFFSSRKKIQYRGDYFEKPLVKFNMIKCKGCKNYSLLVTNY